MLHRLRVGVLVQALMLLLLAPAGEATSLGMTVHAVPLESDGGKTVRAHFTVIAPTPCPGLTGLCAEGEDCLVYNTAVPFNGSKPGPGWCVRQWQKNVSSNYTGSIRLGSNTEFYVSLNAGPLVRENSKRLNHPAFVALPPPLRARVDCPRRFHLSVKDLDGDRVRCRFAQPNKGECDSCPEHAFIELDQDKCMVTFTGKASAGTYFIYLMAEDLIPVPKNSRDRDNRPLSAVPVHLSLTVEKSLTNCSDEPLASGDTPDEDSKLSVLPFQEAKFSVHFVSLLESVLEMAVVGPPGLFRINFNSVGPLSTMAMAWVRSQNQLAPLLPVCFAANTKSLQSMPRCLWLYQREMQTLPAGTELKCEKTEMTLVLPIASLSNINISELQLNSPTCPVFYNHTHLTARIALNGCGTKIVHAGSELVYTNTLQSVRPYTMVSRKPVLILPLACRIPGSQVKGPRYQVHIPQEKEVFGDVRFEITFFLPGSGPMASFTNSPKLREIVRTSSRTRREAGTKFFFAATAKDDMTPGKKINQIDMHLSSNCTVARAELLVSQCIKSETADFKVTKPILSQGCASSNSTLEIVTTKNNWKIYRLNLISEEYKETTMYVECTVHLCITTLASQKCPDLCSDYFNKTMLVSNLYSQSYKIRSGPISLVYTTRAPPITSPTPPPTTTTTTNTASHVPGQISFVAAVILTTLSLSLQNIFLF